MPKLAKDKLCTGCMACVDACHHGAITSGVRYGQMYPIVDVSKCVDCGSCERHCPIVKPVAVNDLREMKVYGGWANDEQVRLDGASGGGFAGLAHSFFHAHVGELVAIVGASLNDNSVNHIMVEKEEDIYRLTNSKYIQSHTDGIYRCVEDKLRNGYWVLFSGCPCHIAALYGYLGKLRGSERLMTVEVVCHGIASQEALDLHLEYYKSSRIYRFRDKRLGTQDWKYSQTTTIEQNGLEYKCRRKEDMFYAIYAGWLLDRRSCHNCRYAVINRVADITLGDFWGLDVPDYYKQGVSLIITNNRRANEFVCKADAIYLFEGSLRTAIDGNPHLFTGFKFIQYHPMVMFPDFFRKILPKKLRFNILANQMPYKLFWALFKVATMLSIKYRYRKLVIQLQADKEMNHLLRKINMGGGKVADS